MKLNAAFLFFIFLSFSIFSQTEDAICGDFDTTVIPPDPPGVYSYSTDPTMLDNLEPLVYNIYFWGINDELGTTPVLTEDDVLLAVANLNLAYNEFNIFFKYKGLDHFLSNTYYSLTTEIDFYDLVDFAEDNGYIEENSFNVFVPADIEDYTGIAQYYNKTRIGVKFDRLTDGYIMAHEIGHCFDLIHTFYAHDNSSGECERVTRDVTALDYNATTHGDRVVDTAACSENYSTDSCLYDDDKTDCVGTPYEIFEKDIRSFMGYRHGDCRDSFTVGQKIRIREAITYDELGNFAEAQTTIASLYAPYKGEYYLGGPALPASDKPLFQPGFDYSFIECRCANNDNSNCSQPTAYDDISFQNLHTIISIYSKDYTPYDDITHPNHTAILIEQLDTGQTRKCYDNYNQAPNGGSVTKFNDGVFNANVTITPQDSTAINDPNLIDDLDVGLYKIEKNYNNGATQETVIIKENDE